MFISKTGRIIAIISAIMAFILFFSACTAHPESQTTPEPAHKTTPEPAPKTTPESAPENTRNPVAVTTPESTVEPTDEATADPNAPDSEWLVENAWPIAQLANENFGLNFRREDNFIVPYTYQGGVYKYAVSFPGDEAAISVFFEYEGTDAWHITYSNIGAEGWTLQGRYEEVELSSLLVTEEELSAAGITLDGTDADYLKIAKYCAQKKAERYTSCSEDNAYHCLEAAATEPYVYQPTSSHAQAQPNDCRVPLRFRPADIRSFLEANMDIGCGITGPDDPYPGWVYFHLDLAVFIERTADGWNCNMGYGS